MGTTEVEEQKQRAPTLKRFCTYDPMNGSDAVSLLTDPFELTVPATGYI